MASELELIDGGLAALRAWEATWAAFEIDETLRVSDEQLRATVAELTERLRDNYPFFHPAYAGQMLKPPHPIATIAYFLAQQINPNNHALDGGPATAAMEREVVAELATMFGYDPATALGHLTSSGTIANLEALWIARSLHPDQAIAFSAEAHYTHGRMCEVIGARALTIATDQAGRLDLADLDAKSASGEIGTVVATAGTTALGAVDPIDQIVMMGQERGFRVHVDAAYGGFFALLATLGPPGPPILGRDGKERAVVVSPQDWGAGGAELRNETAAAFRAIAAADSIVVDPHKHGLQPYGCGSVLFRDAAVGRFYRHDSPYTYFTSDELHLGEISLECSRAGAAAAALWATLRCFPPRAEEGLGPILRKTRAAALAWAELIRADPRFRLVVEPELDIVAFYPLPADGDRRVSRISALTNRVFAATMSDPLDPCYLAKLVVKPSLLGEEHGLTWDESTLTTLRSVLMKPEHLAEVPRLHARVVKALPG